MWLFVINLVLYSPTWIERLIFLIKTYLLTTFHVSSIRDVNSMPSEFIECFSNRFNLFQ